MRAIPYPASAFSLSLRFHPFCWGLHFYHNKEWTEHIKAQGGAIWWLRVGCFTLSYQRML